MHKVWSQERHSLTSFPFCSRHDICIGWSFSLCVAWWDVFAEIWEHWKMHEYKCLSSLNWPQYSRMSIKHYSEIIIIKCIECIGIYKDGWGTVIKVKPKKYELNPKSTASSSTSDQEIQTTISRSHPYGCLSAPFHPIIISSIIEFNLTDHKKWTLRQHSVSFSNSV